MNITPRIRAATGIARRRSSQPVHRLCSLLAMLPLGAGAAWAQASSSPAAPDEVVNVSAPTPGGYATQARFHSDDAFLGPLGNQPILTTPTSITVLPQDLLVDQQIRTVNDALRDLPSVEVLDQEGQEVSRPQSRGFQGTIAQNTRLDGLNIIGTTAIATENLDDIQVLNGLAGALYGPETGAGVFDYVLKRPTDAPLARLVGSYDSNGLFTEEADLGGRTGPDRALGYRIDLVHGEGQSYLSGSFDDRTLVSGDFDIHLDDRTVIQLDASYYEDTSDGLPGGFVYASGRNTLLPAAVDPTRVGYGQLGAGTNLITDTGLGKIIHRFDDDWSLEVGGLYQSALRNLFGITNTLTDNNGDTTTTKNFNNIPHYTIGSNEGFLHGHVRLFGLVNDITLGTTGFDNGQFSYRKSITTPLGKASLADPVVFAYRPVPPDGGFYRSGTLFQQSIIEADTLHLTDTVAIQPVFSESFLQSRTFNTKDVRTSGDSANGVFSPTVSLIYTPTKQLTAYFTYASSVEQGDEAPTGTANVNQFLEPYHDELYEGGVKYAVSPRLLLTLDGFDQTRPFANTLAPSNVFQVIGQQRDVGAELFAQGEVTNALSVLGGVTYTDARLLDTGSPATEGGQIVGVPGWKTDVSLDYHPRFAGGLALTGAAHYQGPRATTTSNVSFAPAYVTFDLGIRDSITVLRHAVIARLGAINVGDVKYYSSIGVGNISGAAGANTAYLGTPRTILASLEFDL